MVKDGIINDRKLNRSYAPEVKQHVEKGVRIFATGQAHHDPVALFDHIVIGNRFAGFTTQALLQFFGFVRVDRFAPLRH